MTTTSSHFANTACTGCVLYARCYANSKADWKVLVSTCETLMISFRSSLSSLVLRTSALSNNEPLVPMRDQNRAEKWKNATSPLCPEDRSVVSSRCDLDDRYNKQAASLGFSRKTGHSVWLMVTPVLWSQQYRRALLRADMH